MSFWEDAISTKSLVDFGGCRFRRVVICVSILMTLSIAFAVLATEKACSGVIFSFFASSSVSHSLFFRFAAFSEFSIFIIFLLNWFLISFSENVLDDFLGFPEFTVFTFIAFLPSAFVCLGCETIQIAWRGFNHCPVSFCPGPFKLLITFSM